MLQNMEEMLLKAQKGKYAVAQFNINNLEWTKFILEACNELQTPVILGVSEGAAKYMGGYLTVASMVKGLLVNFNIPVALHLDHGSSFEVCKEAIDAGFTSVMIDASKYDIDTNIEITKQVVEYAKDKNVTVEAEVGAVGGSEDGVASELAYAKLEDAIKLVEETKVFCLAPALGSVHGIYKGEPCLDFERMVKIRDSVKVPLVLHGGSGIYDDLIRQAINCGICKININTELQLSWSKAVREFLSNDNTTYDPRKIIKSGEEELKKVVKEKVMLFGSEHKN